MSSNLPRRLLSFVSWRSPSKTWISTTCWLSTAVEKMEGRCQSLYGTQERVSLHLGLHGRDHVVAADELGHHTTSGLNTDGQRVDIDKDNVRRAFFTSEDATLDGSSVSDGFIGLNPIDGSFLKYSLRSCWTMECASNH